MVTLPILSRQDQLILSAIAGSIAPNLVPFIASATTSSEAWNILANTYVKPSRGRLTQLKEDLQLLEKRTQSVTEYMQQIKVIVDELAMFNVPIDNEDVILKVLAGLDDEYSAICSAMRARETPVTFDELHEKLINHEAHLKYEAKKSQISPTCRSLSILHKSRLSLHPKTTSKIVPLTHQANIQTSNPSLNTRPPQKLTPRILHHLHVLTLVYANSAANKAIPPNDALPSNTYHGTTTLSIIPPNLPIPLVLILLPPLLPLPPNGCLTQGLLTMSPMTSKTCFFTPIMKPPLISWSEMVQVFILLTPVLPLYHHPLNLFF